MGLIDDLKLVSNRKGPQCTVGAMLDSLSPDEAQAVLAIIDDPDGSLVGLSKVLQNYGKGISPRTLRRHRHRGDTSKDGCACQ
jgi:hypothetical protein